MVKKMRQEDWNEEWVDHPPEESDDLEEYCARCGLPYFPKKNDGDFLCDECLEELRNRIKHDRDSFDR